MGGRSPEQHHGSCASDLRVRDTSATRNIDPEDVIGMDALWDSLNKCLRGVRWKGRPAYWQLHAAEMLSALYDDLHAGTYTPRPTVTFTVTRPKVREIVATDFRDRVAQRTYNDNLIYPIMSRSWIYDNYACQAGKGADFARERLRAHLERYVRAHGTDGWILQLDIRGYYRNMRHDIVEARFGQKLPDWGYSFVRQTFAHQYTGDTGYNPGSQMVQIAGIDYLDPLDHLIKERLRVKGYGRYMDDLFVIGQTKSELENALATITDWLAGVGLEPHPAKTRIHRLTEPSPFLGFDFLLAADGHVLMLAQPPKIKQARRDMAKLTRLAHQGRIVPEQLHASNTCRLAHLGKCDNRATIRRLEDYQDRLMKGVTKCVYQGSSPH